MTLIEAIRTFFSKKQGPVHIQDLYSELPDELEHSIRARIYERLGKEFRRVGRGLYVAYNEARDVTCLVACDDAWNALRHVPSRSVDAVITDPPYSWVDHWLRQGTTRKRRGSWTFETRDIDLELGQELYRVLRRGAHVLLFAPSENAETKDGVNSCIELLKKCGLRFNKSLIWHKVRLGMGYRGRACHERILFFSKGHPRKPLDLSMPDVLSVRSIHPRERRHEAEKPVGLLERLVRFATKVGELVLDPFAGSCSTGRAALRTGRNSLLIEKSEAMLSMAFNLR